MRFYADLHVHSRFSRATSSDCDLFHLAYWARRKGITVVGTGDFTHPAWMQELKNQLVPAEPGLYRLRDDLDRAVDERLAAPCRSPTRFMLSVEISTIYKKGDRTRKIHHLIYAPDFEAADRLSRALGRVGNLLADGRPILGLDSRHLLEATLESSEGSYLVPAHIWTPWFSVLGSKAGFDAVDECYGDLARHVFALETGLSSDPAMNWRISQLDRYRLVSSSDAHSPAKLGREATAFDTPLDYFYIKRALETGEGFGGTVEFFPEEGKYHLDGHRSCKVVLEPSETRARKEICPACGRPVTVGVLHRVEALADRAEGFRPEGASDFKCMVPLPEILGELHGVGADSRAVRRSYDELLSRVGPELYLLEEAPMEEIERAGPPRLWEALSRMRAGQVIRKAGYDGEYGVIRLFQPEELRKGRSARLLFEERKVKETESVKANASGAVLAGLDADQRAAAEVTRGPLLILAGPGTGKTRTLTHRIAHLVRDEGAAPEACLTITFTRRAAEELRERLSALLGPDGARVPAMTFHALGLSILREHAGLAAALRGGETEAPISVAGDEERRAILAEAAGVAERRIPRMLQAISGWKRRSPRGPAALPEGGPEPSEEIARAWQAYEAAMAARGLLDLDDLVGLAAALVEAHPEVGEALRSRYRYVSIDEYQDIDAQQYRLARFLVGDAGDVCAIGDPDQAIYGFRGADVGFFFRFQQDFPAARVVRLRQSYRSSRAIVDAALSVIAPSPTLGARELVARFGGEERITIQEAPTARAEAEQVVHAIERLIGGSTFFSRDSGRVGADEQISDLSFSEVAILYRTEAQAGALQEALARSGMPFQRRSHRGLVERPAAEAIAQALRRAGSERPVVDQLRDAAAALREEVARPASEGGGEEAATPTLTEADVDAAAELLLPLARRCGGDVRRFLLELGAEVEVDAWDPRADRISLLTLHASKGLEFRVVFMVGCEDGLLPLRIARDEDPDIAEERRLFYVGMTRARERLTLTWARERVRRGQLVRNELSPFAQEITEALQERKKAELPRRPEGPANKQLKLF